MGSRYILFIIILLSLGSCIERIDGIVGGYEELMVVEGLISNENVPYEIRLTKSVANISDVPENIVGALVFVEDDKGSTEPFYETDPGKYVSRLGQFVGMVGNSYRLSIKLKNGKEYLSDWCELLPAGSIDSAYIESDPYDSDYLGGGNDGLSIYVDSKGYEGTENYLKWTYAEDWKFHSYYLNSSVIKPDNSVEEIGFNNYICWKANSSNSILIHSSKGLSSNEYKHKRILNSHASQTDRFSIRYSILIKQNNISAKEYAFWKNLDQSNQGSLDLFGKQPYSIVGNVYNVNDPKESVLGYFQVAGVASKRIYINPSDLSFLKISNYYYKGSGCAIDTVMIDTANNNAYSEYAKYHLSGSMAFVSPYWSIEGELLGLFFAPNICVDCTITGKKNPPDYWVEK